MRLHLFLVFTKSRALSVFSADLEFWGGSISTVELVEKSLSLAMEIRGLGNPAWGKPGENFDLLGKSRLAAVETVEPLSRILDRQFLFLMPLKSLRRCKVL